MAKSKQTSNRTVSKKSIREMIQGTKEIKACAVSTTFVDTTGGTVGPITQQIIQGDNVNQRSGDVISPIKLELNLSMLGGVGSTQSFHRFIVFQDMLNTGVAPVIADVLDGGAYNSTYAITNRQQRRFKILYDKMHGVVSGSNSNATHVQLKLKPAKRIYYNGLTSVTSANGKGSIWFLCMTDSITVATATVAFYAVTSYTDS